MAKQFGYAGKILRVDLSSQSATDSPTSDYSDRFLGGRGMAAKIYWDEVSPQAGAFDSENELLFVTGPLAGLWQIPEYSSCSSRVFLLCQPGRKLGSSTQVCTL